MSEYDAGPAAQAAPRWRTARSVIRRLVTAVLFALAAILAFAGAAFLGSHYAHPRFALPLTTAQAAPLLICRRRPVTAWIATVTASLGAAVIATPLGPGQPWPWTPVALIAFLCVQFAVAVSRPWWVGVACWCVAATPTAIVAVVARAPSTAGQNPTLVLMLAAVATLGGQIVWIRRQARRRIIRHERLSAEERARRHLLEERSRIARELHDVVAHHMSVIAVQASTAEYRIGNLSADARDEFQSIGASARDSLAEMRRLLEVLRRPDAESKRSPQPNLSRLGEVVRTARRAGADVTLDLRDVPTDLPDTVGLSAFRIVQEALSNVVRHAPGATARVEVVAGAADLVVRVDNDPPPGPARGMAESTGTGHGAESTGTGHGLVGMRERAAMLGGELVAHPRADGGFTVRAVLPLSTPKPSDEQGDT